MSLIFFIIIIYQLNEWNQVGATYDNTTGVAQLWHNGKMVKSRNIGQIKLATQYPIRIGARDGDDRRFAGKIACLQIYNKALDEQQIGNLKSCPVKGNAFIERVSCIKCRKIKVSAEFKWYILAPLSFHLMLF